MFSVVLGPSGSALALLVTRVLADHHDAALADAAGLRSTLAVEDAAQGLGASLGGRPIGAARTACFSFYTTTNLPVGEGGMVTTDDAERAARIRAARSNTGHRHRRPSQHNGVIPGSGLRDGGLEATMTDLRAAMGRGQLEHLASWQRRREHIAAMYDGRLAGIEGVVLPHRPPTGAGQHAWHHYPLRIEQPHVPRDEIIRALLGARIRTDDRITPLHRLRYARDMCEVPDGGLPGADQFAAQLVSLPIYPRLSDGVADRVAEVLAETLSRR
jgi:dTDP-4-amino-4,6-dideoxygalactose transaminase